MEELRTLNDVGSAALLVFPITASLCGDSGELNRNGTEKSRPQGFQSFRFFPKLLKYVRVSDDQCEAKFPLISYW